MLLLTLCEVLPSVFSFRHLLQCAGRSHDSPLFLFKFPTRERVLGKKQPMSYLPFRKSVLVEEMKLLGASSYLTSHFDAQVSRLSCSGILFVLNAKWLCDHYLMKTTCNELSDKMLCSLL